MLFTKHFRGLHLSMCQTTPEALAVFQTNDVRYSEVVAMGWKYSDANLKEEKATELIQELIQGMAEGNASHQANGLKFGLYNALRQRGMGDYPFAQLRCRQTDCKYHRCPVSYADLDDSIYCTRHNGSSSGTSTLGVMECTKCGHTRTDRFSWCQGCRGMFQ